MAVSRALRRLLRVLEIEEEQCQLALKSALSELGRLEQLMTSARTREREGRQLVVRSAFTGELPDRLAGLQESRWAAKRALMLEIKITDSRLLVAELRRVYLAKRVERRQAEMLIREIETRDAVVAARHGQQDIDDWYLNRLHGQKGGTAHNCDGNQKNLLEEAEKKLQ